MRKQRCCRGMGTDLAERICEHLAGQPTAEEFEQRELAQSATQDPQPQSRHFPVILFHPAWLPIEA